MKYNIKDKEFWEDFKLGRLVVNCETKEEFKELLEECGKQGLIWKSGRPATEKIGFWDNYTQYMCLESYKNKLMHSDVRWFEEYDRKIIKFKDIENSNKTYTLDEVMQFKIGTNVRCIDDGSVLLIKAGLIIGEKMLWFKNLDVPYGLSSIYFEKKFELVEEWEEVDFMKAMEAYYSNKIIRCNCDYDEYIFGNGENIITDLSNDDEFMDMVFNGKWFVKNNERCV